jgi:oligopeptide/dipeptide ABC transporter ATP-binding protein
MTHPLMMIESLYKEFSLGGGFLQRRAGIVVAVDDVDLQIYEGQTLGLVGESGCGKSTLARILMRLEDPQKGKVSFDGRDIFSFSSKEMKTYRRHVQMVFQDPYSSLNPRKTALGTIVEPLNIHGLGSRDQNKKTALQIMDKVGLTNEQAKRYPHEFSGGQRQRIGIARALVLRPRLIIADEPVSALDASIQAQILNLLKDLKDEFGLTYLFISHDLNVIRHVSDRIAVMYLGQIVEVADRRDLYNAPAHPYTRMLLAAIPSCVPGATKQPIMIRGETGDRADGGCRFYNRCIYKIDICRKEKPALMPAGQNRWSACHRTGEI